MVDKVMAAKTWNHASIFPHNKRDNELKSARKSNLNKVHTVDHTPIQRTFENLDNSRSPDRSVTSSTLDTPDQDFLENESVNSRKTSLDVTNADPDSGKPLITSEKDPQLIEKHSRKTIVLE